jgi:uncharacterized protein YuzE
MRAHHGVRIDLDERGALIGLEIAAPWAVTISALNSVLTQHGVAALNDEEWAPLAA